MYTENRARSECNDKNVYLKAMYQPDHMIDMVIYISVNFCPCKIRY